MKEFREQLIIAVTKASVGKVGVDVNNNDFHAEAILKLVDSIVEKMDKKKDKK